MNLVELLSVQARERPAQAAIVQSKGGEDVAITFAELERRSAQAAGLLAKHGVRAENRVLLLVPMSIDLYVALLGILRLGAVAMLVDPGAGVGQLARASEIARPNAMIG